MRIREISRSFEKILLSSLVAFVVAYFVRQNIADFVNMQTFTGIFIQTFFTAAVGAFIYIFLTMALKSPELGTFMDSVKKQIKKSDYGPKTI